MLLTCLVLTAAAFVYAVLRVAGAWYEKHVAQHDLIAESKQRRLDYLKAVAEREQQLLAAEQAEAFDSIIIEDDEPSLAQAA